MKQTVLGADKKLPLDLAEDDGKLHMGQYDAGMVHMETLAQTIDQIQFL